MLIAGSNVINGNVFGSHTHGAAQHVGMERHVGARQQRNNRSPFFLETTGVWHYVWRVATWVARKTGE